MPTKTPQPTFTVAQQTIRARLATLNPTQFEALKSVLQQAASAVDIRIAQLDAERAQLTNQKTKLVKLLAEFGKSAAGNLATQSEGQGSRHDRFSSTRFRSRYPKAKESLKSQGR